MHKMYKQKGWIIWCPHLLHKVLKIWPILTSNWKHLPCLAKNNLIRVKVQVTNRNLVICNQSLCNWHETNCRLQLSWSYLQLQIWYCIIFRPYGCVCN
jgi:hypothetical protein